MKLVSTHAHYDVYLRISWSITSRTYGIVYREIKFQHFLSHITRGFIRICWIYLWNCAIFKHCCTIISISI